MTCPRWLMRSRLTAWRRPSPPRARTTDRPRHLQVDAHRAPTWTTCTFDVDERASAESHSLGGHHVDTALHRIDEFAGATRRWSCGQATRRSRYSISVSVASGTAAPDASRIMPTTDAVSELSEGGRRRRDGYVSTETAANTRMRSPPGHEFGGSIESLPVGAPANASSGKQYGHFSPSSARGDDDRDDRLERACLLGVAIRRVVAAQRDAALLARSRCIHEGVVFSHALLCGPSATACSSRP